MKKIFLLDIAGEEKYLTTIRNFFSEAVRESGFIVEESDAAYLEMAINEFCENIIKYGYSGKPGRILLRIIVESDRISAVIIDRGVPHNILEYDPISKETLVEKGLKGKLGIRMIKTVCDRIYYKRLKGKNKTILIKYSGNHKPGKSN